MLQPFTETHILKPSDTYCMTTPGPPGWTCWCVLVRLIGWCPDSILKGTARSSFLSRCSSTLTHREPRWKPFPHLLYSLLLEISGGKGRDRPVACRQSERGKEREREIDTVKEEGERLLDGWIEGERGREFFAIPAVQPWSARLPRRPLESWLDERCCIHRPCTCQMGVVEGWRVRKRKEPTEEKRWIKILNKKQRG